MGEHRAAAVEVVRKLVKAGHVAYFAGGCVRDALLGQEPLDYDVATDARPEQIVRVFPRARGVGESFAVLLVRRGRHTIEVATFRTDGVYADGRHPNEVTFSDAEHDARRRDFTINGLFEDPLAGEIIDFVDGRSDLEARVIRAIGDATERLTEDRLRMLRAIRFAARFQFAIEPATADAIRAGAGHLQGVSRERIGQEVRWMLSDANRPVAAWEMQYLGLDAIVLGEANTLIAPKRLGRLPADAPYPTALAAWMLDRHEAAGVPLDDVTRRWSGALMLAVVERRALDEALAVHRTLQTTWGRLGVAAQKRLAASDAFDQGLLLLGSTRPQDFVDVRRRVEELARTGLAPAPLISGRDLIDAGMEPGPAFKRLLDVVYDAQLEGSIRTLREALDLVHMIRSSGEGFPGVD